MKEEILLKIFRFDPDVDQKPHFDTYEVKTRLGMTVLEALFDVLENQDGSLSFRYACRGAVCGSCAMHINGKYRLACQTQIKDLRTSSIKIKPLGHLPVIKDLVVDMSDFFEKYEKIKPYLINEGVLPEKEFIQSIDQRKKLDEMIDCILCSCCFASCPMTLTNEKYLGPAALMKANRFAVDSRDSDKERLKIVNSEDGVWRCHTVFNCVEVCPKKLNPTAFIASLKRKIIVQRT